MADLRIPLSVGSKQTCSLVEQLNFQLTCKTNEHTLSLETPVAHSSGTNDYEKLYNKPSINGTELVGDYTITCKSDTTQAWDSQLSFVPEKGELIVYIDRHTLQDGTAVPGFKIGDGKAYLIDLPYVDDYALEKFLSELEIHTRNTEIHITQAERELWNNKINCVVDTQSETLVINRD